ncbi:MAG: rod shape-determining protein RodA [Bacteroidia bacterium]|jgi:rod shape determining protein RodA|nr:rod shape-determining protein RodA [Bacteroidia bacterium]
MSDRRHNILRYTDWFTISLYALLVIIGWLNIYSAVYNPAHPSVFDTSQRYGKQIIWILTAFLLAFFIMLTEASFFSVFAYMLYGIALLSLVAVIFVGRNVKGSHSWFHIGTVSIQPAELGIFAINLGLAKYLSGENVKIKKAGTLMRTLALLFIPMLAIVLQNETGVAVTYVSFVIVLYREGMSGSILLALMFAALLFIMALVGSKLILTGILAGIAAVVFLIFTRRKTRDLFRIGGILILSVGILWGADYGLKKLEPHQRDRIEVFLHPNANKSKQGYNLNQAKIAIGSGSFWGKGYLEGTQTKFHFVPEQATDFIFCTLCEEWGFAGASVVIFLFIVLLIRIVMLAERQRSPFSRIYGYGVASILFIHIAINTGMTLGIVPVIGIPLPFFSYGGSSLWAFTLLLFIFLRLDADRLQILK